MKFTNLLWTLPFICFIGTYIGLSFIFAAPSIEAPSLIGKQLPQALSMLSQHNLNPRILREQVDNDVPAGTVLSQIPAAGQKVKPHQQLFITISKLADKATAPQLIGKPYEKIAEHLKSSNIRHKAYHLASKKPKDTIITQIPKAGTPLDHNTMIVYVSQGNTKPVICPQFTHRSVQEVTQFLSAYNIKPELYHVGYVPEGHVCSSCIILNQQPLAGSILDLDKGVTVQLKAREEW